MAEEKLEVMLVDDELQDLEGVGSRLSERGYGVITAGGGYQAIDQLAIRLHEDRNLPDIYLCDMLDRHYVIAKIEINRWGSTELKDIHPTAAFNIFNYLESKDIRPQYFVAHSFCLSEEDMAIAEDLGIPLIRKLEGLKESFPDVSELSKEQAMEKFAENYAQMLKDMKGEGES